MLNEAPDSASGAGGGAATGREESGADTLGNPAVSDEGLPREGVIAVTQQDREAINRVCIHFCTINKF